jgi:hypothetical protein
VIHKTVEIHGSAEPYLKPEELAQLLNIKAETICEWARKYPDFPALRLPGVIRVRVSELEKWLERFAPTIKEVR